MARMRDFQDDMSEKGKKLRKNPTIEGHVVEKEITTDKTFDEQILDLKKEIESLPEDQQELAGKVLENYANRANKTEVIANEIDKYIAEHPEFDPLCVIKRPEDMSFDAYKILRKAGNRSIKQYLKRRNG